MTCLRLIILCCVSISLSFCNRPTSMPDNVHPFQPASSSETRPTPQIPDPHDTEFKTTFLHGVAYFKDEQSCQTCHGVDFSGGLSNTACTKCHPYPHPLKWSFPKNHGETYAQKQKACLICHTLKSAFHIRHPQKFVSCGQCHTQIPHTADFQEGDHADLAKTYEGKCTQCHTDLRKYLPNQEGEGCRGCHDEDEKPILRWRNTGRTPEKK